MGDKKITDYICPRPFETLYITERSFNSCCPDWNNINPNLSDYEVENIWESDVFNDFRSSILDGTFRHCQKCPYVQMTDNENGNIDDLFILKTDGTKLFENHSLPKELILSIDKTCNYKCPSCRVDLIVSNGTENKNFTNIINKLESKYSKGIETIYTSGSSEPFASPPIRNFFRNFDSSKYERLKTIQINTNGSLFTEKMWNSMPNIHPYVQNCTISIDAGTKYTYENLVRINGNWDKLIENLKFISTIETITNIRTLFVVQKCNYKEMDEHVNVIKEIFGDRVKISFTNITNWGTFSDEEFSDRNVSDPNHTEYEQLKIESNKVLKHKEVDFFYSLYSKLFK